MNSVNRQRLDAVTSHRLFWPVVAWVVLLLGNTIFTPGFLKIEIKQGHLYGSLIDIMNFGAPLLLVSLGMTLVIATAGIDLSVGAVVAIAGAIAALRINDLAHPNGVAGVLGAVGIALVLSLLLGAWNGFLVAGLGIQPIIATLVLMVAGRGVAQLITGGQNLEVRSDPYALIGGGYWLTLPFPMIVALLVCLVVAVAVRRTALGVLIEAIGGNPEASRLAGVRWRSLLWMVYAVCGLTAGIAGLMISSNLSVADGNHAGLWIELDAILAVVIGGTQLTGGRFSIGGTIVGALLIETLTQTIYTIGIPPETNTLFKAIVVILVCLMQSPAFRAKVFRRRQRLPLNGGRGPGSDAVPASTEAVPSSAAPSAPSAESESSTEVSA